MRILIVCAAAVLLSLGQASAQTLPSPSVATPVSPNQAAPKGYIDTAVAAANAAASAAQTTANTGVTNAGSATTAAAAAQSTANAALPNTVPALTALLSGLPTTLPATAGKLWNNGGLLSVS